MQKKINLISKFLISTGLSEFQKKRSYYRSWLLIIFNVLNFSTLVLIKFIILTSLTNKGYLGRPIQYLYLCIIYIIANNLKKESINI